MRTMAEGYGVPRTATHRTYDSARWVFLRALGAIYLVAFLSLWLQIHGLVGSAGIVPAERFFAFAHQRLGAGAFLELPSLFWLYPSDIMLHVLCLIGSLCAVLLILDRMPALMALLVWVTYLSVVTVGQDFCSFQWDNLLLEAGFLAILFAWHPSRITRWLYWWLLFRLMCASGVVKLASGDVVWRDLTALTYHFETQPLTVWVAWYVHQLPVWVLRAACGVMFIMELLVPFAIFMRPPVRYVGCGLLVVFQLLIMCTGNYNFFNLLTIALCLLLLDDAVWPTWLRARVVPVTVASTHTTHWRRWVVVPVAVLMACLTLAPMGRLIGWRYATWPAPIAAVFRWTYPFRSVNSYGLFATMTIARPEIVIEGSYDGREWLPYTFKHKPGDVTRQPRFIAPHQPRLDWQMWFAALGPVERSPWFLQLCQRLLEGSPRVLALLDTNPFPGRPPVHIRARLYDYRFTDWPTRRETGRWWLRSPIRVYLPPVSLQRAVPPPPGPQR